MTKERDKEIEIIDLLSYDSCSCDEVASDNEFCFIHKKEIYD